MSSTSPSPQFRTRDGIAMIVLVYICSMAYNSNNNNMNSDNDLSASIRFAFYIPQQLKEQPQQLPPQQHKERLLSMLDIDGDDISEVLALWSNPKSPSDDVSTMISTEWTLQLFDLSRISLSSMNSNNINNNHKNQYHQRNRILPPFRPPIMFNASSSSSSSSSSTIRGTTQSLQLSESFNQHENDFHFEKHDESTKPKIIMIPFHPLAMTTGHIIFPTTTNHNDPNHPVSSSLQHETTTTDTTTSQTVVATNFYYCGTDWHDASTKCQQSCPSGSGCPEGQRCFADCTNCSPSTTSTSNQKSHTADDTTTTTTTNMNLEYHRTIANGWPSICTVWSQGQITMHTITAEKDSVMIKSSSINNTSHDTNKKKQSSVPPKLQLRQLWNVTILKTAEEDDTNEQSMEPKVELEDVAITFVDPMSSEMIFPSTGTSDPNNKNDNHGIVIVTGTVTVYYYTNETEQNYDNHNDKNKRILHTIDSATIVMAYNAYTGERIWHTSSSYEMEQLLLLPNSKTEMNQQLSPNDRIATNGLIPPLPPRHNGGPIGSILRRRSGMVSTRQRRQQLQQRGNLGYDEYEQLKRHGTTLSNVNCLTEYRRSIFTTFGTLPYQYDGTNEYNSAKIMVTHFDHQGMTTTTKNSRHTTTKTKHNPYSNNRNKKRWSGHTKARNAKKAKKWYGTHHDHVEYGRPNVVVVHNYQGIQVFALRNGRSLCHVSLSDRTLYDDIDHDGRIDMVQLSNIGPYGNILGKLNDTEFDNDDDEAIAQREFFDRATRQLILQKINGSMNDDASYGSYGSGSEKLNVNNKNTNGKDVVPCYALSIMSGFPSAEQTRLKAIPCRTANSDNDDYYRTINHAPLLVIDTPIVTTTSHQNHVRYTKDIVVALNNGMMGRISGKFGHWLWKRDVYEPNNAPPQSSGSDLPPTWKDPSMVALQQIYINHYKDTNSPMALVGQQSIAIISSMTGRIIAVTPLPQISNIQRPYVVDDLNGDGTSDIIIVTNDAIWGYTIFVRPMSGMSTGYRILVGFVMMGLMLAYLHNRFGPHPGKRSTDL